MSSTKHRVQGVTLLELSIVLVILGVLMKAAITPLAAARELRQIKDVASELDTLKQAIISNLILYGSMPCPQSSQSSSERCTQTSGTLSAVSLGVTGAIDESGALLDPWGRPYQYAVSADTPVWTSKDEHLQTPISDWQSELLLCKHSQRSGCNRGDLRADNIAFVILSLGPDPEPTGDQAENQDDDKTFSVRSPSIQPSDRYDDHVIWATQSELLYWLLRAGVMI